MPKVIIDAAFQLFRKVLRPAVDQVSNVASKSSLQQGAYTGRQPSSTGLLGYGTPTGTNAPMPALASFEASLFYLLGDAIKSGMCQAVEQMDFTSAGAPRVERIETMKAIDARIDEVDRPERELTEQAEQSGLKL